MARRIVAFVAMAAFVATLLGAGTSFAWCPAMAQVMDAPCCAHAEASQRPAVERACCEVRSLPDATPAREDHAASPDVALPAFTLLAWMPGPSATPAPLAREVARPRPLATSHGPPRGPPYRLNCTYLI